MSELENAVEVVENVTDVVEDVVDSEIVEEVVEKVPDKLAKGLTIGAGVAVVAGVAVQASIHYGKKLVKWSKNKIQELKAKKEEKYITKRAGNEEETETENPISEQ